jgi:hypothetical protein
MLLHHFDRLYSFIGSLSSKATDIIASSVEPSLLQRGGRKERLEREIEREIDRGTEVGKGEGGLVWVDFPLSLLMNWLILLQKTGAAPPPPI